MSNLLGRGLVAFTSTALFLMGCEPAEQQRPPVANQAATRIVSLSPHITELVFAAGAGEYLVGVVEYSDYPPTAADVPRVGDAFRVDFEVISLLQPDLVLSWKSGNPVEIIERIRALGYRVVETEPQALESVADQLQLIGELAGTSSFADQAAATLRKRITELGRNSAERESLSVFWQISADPYFTVTERHIINEIIELCGGQNIFADVSGVAPTVTLEAVLAEQPDVIIASVAPADAAWKEGWQRWAQLPAVQKNHLYGVDPDLISRAGPRIIDGAEQVCAALEDARG